MLKIRLQRVGKKHEPSFRIVLTDSARAARSCSVNEVLGFYSAKREQTKLSGEKIIKGPKKNVLPPKKKSAEETKAKALTEQTLHTTIGK